MGLPPGASQEDISEREITGRPVPEADREVSQTPLAVKKESAVEADGVRESQVELVRQIYKEKELFQCGIFEGTETAKPAGDLSLTLEPASPAVSLKNRYEVDESLPNIELPLQDMDQDPDSYRESDNDTQREFTSDINRLEKCLMLAIQSGEEEEEHSKRMNEV